jgi:BNR repeat-like domain
VVRALFVTLALGVSSIAAASAYGAVSLTRLSADPYTNTTSQHRTEVEPDTFGYGSTVVGAFQAGRFYDGGASNIGWATSTDAGSTWSHGFLRGITTYAGGPYARVSDPSVAFDARHGVWIISSLALSDTPSVAGAAVVVSRSSDGGLTWGKPVVVASDPGGSLDKNWTVCDNTAASPYYGRCYTEWDDNADSNRIKMSTSADGGLSWGVARNTADNATGLGGQPVVRPNGTVIVPIDNAAATGVRAFKSINGGASWSNTVTVSAISKHTVAGGVRTPSLISAEIDGAGKVYVVWQDCRFRSSCAANDIVMSTSFDGVTWSSVKRIPIDATTSGQDHFIPGIGVDRATSGSSAHLGLVYHFYPSATCTASTCQLNVGYVSSTNGGSTWSAPTTLAGPMSIAWLPATSQGRMFGDYVSTSIVSGKALPVIPVAAAPSAGLFHQAMNAPTGGLTLAAGSAGAQSASGSSTLPPGSASPARERATAR